MRHQPWHTIKAIVVCFIVSSCGLGDLLEDPTDWPGDTDVKHYVVRVGYGLIATIPNSWNSREMEDKPSSDIPAGCQVRSGAMSQPGTTFHVRFQLNESGCDVDQTSNFPRYVRLDNVADPRDVEYFDTSLGPATMFLDTSETCSTPGAINGVEPENPKLVCKLRHKRVILIELDNPFDPNFPTLQISWIEPFDDEPAWRPPSALQSIAQAIEYE